MTFPIGLCPIGKPRYLVGPSPLGPLSKALAAKLQLITNKACNQVLFRSNSGYRQGNEVFLNVLSSTVA